MRAREACIALAHVVEPGDPDVAALVARHGPLDVIARIEADRLPLRTCGVLRERLQRTDVATAEASAARIGARIIARDDADWPSQLDDLGDDRPYALWALGTVDLRLALARSVSVVGTREATTYGEHVTRQWCSQFAEQGITIVSGGAFGIDAAAHRAALACEGLTICVLAGGVDIPYPRAHEALIARIADEGLVLSESPLGEAPRRHRFLTRNRIIAALTQATLIVESAIRSGTVSTANAATGLHRPLFAVPGPVTSPASAGCHDLISAGTAVLVDRPEPVIAVVAGRPTTERAQALPLPLDDLDPGPARVLDALPSRGSVGASELAVRAALPLRETAAALGHLAARGLVRQGPHGWRRAPRGA